MAAESNGSTPGVAAQQPAATATTGSAKHVPLVVVNDACQEYPAEDGSGGVNKVLHNISFTAERGETVCILGPSGCGKSTILRLVSGMYDRYTPMPTSGTVHINGKLVDGPHDKVLTVFQKPVLKAWLDVRGNILLPFKAGVWGTGVSEEERGRRADEVLEAVGLSKARHLRPRQLSGGMMQRVSLAARLALRPDILCLDEPFSALDPQTRVEMQDLSIELWKQFPCLALFVTHDVSEALRIADRVVVLSTRPATIIMDLTISEPKPRSDAWMNSPEYRQLEDQILVRLRQAATDGAHGSIAVNI